MIRAALASVSRLAVFPMQDLLGLGSEARMNLPGTSVGNWTWRIDEGALTDVLAAPPRGKLTAHLRSCAMMKPHPGVNASEDATWYKDAIIYEVRTRSFFDSNDDGVGDLRGLTSKLPYLQDLGVTAIWLLPFYPSPGRDDGYDISDYTGISPEVGTLTDFEELVAEAHRRGLRVITELVLNHTSDQHPWFQRARRAPGSAERNFYVWGDSPDRYRDARIIFRDFEVSNWTWDREAGAYYWHRFLRAPAGPQLREPRSPGGPPGRSRLLARQGGRRPPARRGALSLRGGGYQLREPAEDARLPPHVARPHRREVPEPHAAGGS